MHNIDSM